MARAFRTLGFPRARCGAVLINAGEAYEAGAKYRARDRGAFFPRDFAVADFVQAFHVLEKAWDS